MIDAALREANEWVADDWQGQVGLWQSLQGCVRGAHALSMRKIRFLCDIPYLLARLAEPGIKDRCVAQFAAVPMAHHHRVSREFLEPGHVSGLFPLVHAINPEASNIDPRLQSEITSLARIPLDDSVGESPHAKAKAIAQRAAGCDFPWVSATMRVRQNIADIRTIAPTLESFDLQEIWDRSSSVIQDSRHLNRAKRIKHEELVKKVYMLHDFGLAGPRPVVVAGLRETADHWCTCFLFAHQRAAKKDDINNT